MKFGPRPLAQAAGLILAHNLADDEGRRLLRKGTVLSEQDLSQIRQLGWSEIYVAELEDGDLGEDEASRRVAMSLVGPGLAARGPANGRTNLHAEATSLVRIDPALLAQVNGQPGITVASLPPYQVVPAGQLVVTVKIIPYGLAASYVEVIERLVRKEGPIIWLDRLSNRKVHLILQGSERVEGSLRNSFFPAIQARVSALGSSLAEVNFSAIDRPGTISAMAEKMRTAVRNGAEVVIVAGETAIMDEADLIPQAVRAAGGHVEVVGAPVDPGNLLMLAYLDGTPILGAPGCARSSKENVVDWVLPRLLTGEELKREDIQVLGPGGLLAEIKDRPMPRTINGDFEG